MAALPRQSGKAAIFYMSKFIAPADNISGKIAIFAEIKRMKRQWNSQPNINQAFVRTIPEVSLFPLSMAAFFEGGHFFIRPGCNARPDNKPTFAKLE